jgi:hypothetical protein
VQCDVGFIGVGVVTCTVKVQKLGLRVVEGDGVVCGPGERHSCSCFEGSSVFLSCSAMSDKGDIVDIARGPERRVGLLEGIEQGAQVYEEEDGRRGGALWNSGLYGALDVGLAVERQHCGASSCPSIPYPHPQHQRSPAFVYGRLRRTRQTRSYAANSSSSIFLLSSLLLSRFIPAPFMLACWGGPV